MLQKRRKPCESRLESHFLYSEATICSDTSLLDAPAAGKNADVMADQLMNQHGVRERIAALKAENAARSGRSRDELIAWLWAIADTGAGEVTKDSPLCQDYRAGDHGTEVHVPDKIAAAQLLVKICGWAKP